MYADGQTFLRYIIYYPMHEADLSKVVAVMRQ